MLRCDPDAARQGTSNAKSLTYLVHTTFRTISCMGLNQRTTLIINDITYATIPMKGAGHSANYFVYAKTLLLCTIIAHFCYNHKIFTMFI